ncbi:MULTISPECIES: terpene synthase family protein [unclassified Streptomyces]|uniref:terpene synthase family protein n=1 Tax=unclassified Streptomyces TaxID=2593676 RepID=UPI00081D9A71|nr:MULTISPECIES: terpene synthase family protein [unclassified Streptomyces]SCD49958.1 2-methylisoborneol synthase [Streptomyces sp. ScaeMP-e83]
MTGDGKAGGVAGGGQVVAVAGDGQVRAMAGGGQVRAVTGCGQASALTDGAQAPAPTGCGQAPSVTDGPQAPAPTGCGQAPSVTDGAQVPALANGAEPSPPTDGGADTPYALAAYARRHLLRLAPAVGDHPMAEELEADVRSWATGHGLSGPGDDGLERRRIGRLVGRCMPGAPFGVARLVARHLAWVFHFDDTVAEHADRLAAHQAWDPPAVLRSGRLPAGAPACAHFTSLISLREDIVAAGGTGLLPLLADGLRRYAESCAREAPWRASGTPPTLAEYLAQRVHTSGGHPMYLHLLAPGMPSGHAPLTAPLTGLAELAFLIGALANDLLGHAAEQRQGDPVNAVTVLAHEYGLPAPEAYRAALVLHAGHQHRFDAACAGLLADAALSEAQRRFVHAVMGWVAGSAAAVEPYWHHLLATHPTRETG